MSRREEGALGDGSSGGFECCLAQTLNRAPKHGWVWVELGRL